MGGGGSSLWSRVRTRGEIASLLYSAKLDAEKGIDLRYSPYL